MDFTIGNAATGQAFFDREELLEDIWTALVTDNVLLAAPRRVGKTSIMHRLKDAPQPGFTVMFVDAQGFDTPAALVAELALGAGNLSRDPKRTARSILRQATDRIEELEIWEIRIRLREAMRANWHEQGERAIADALGAIGARDKLLLVIDELPLLLHKIVSRDKERGRETAGDLLDWLRHVRLHPDFNKRLRMVLGGSIGMARVAAFIGASHKINDLRQIDVGPLNESKARELANGLLASNGVAPEPALVEAILTQAGTLLPIYIQILARALVTDVRGRNVEPTPETVRECYEQRALGSEYRLCFEDYYERLDRYYAPDEARAARRILRELAIAKGPILKSALLGTYRDELGPNADPANFDLLLAWLHDDFYVDKTNGGKKVAVKDKWIRDWWRKHHADAE